MGIHLKSNGIDFADSQTQGSGSTQEVLEHYEEGTWTPVFRCGSSDVSGAASQHGHYCRIGDACQLSFYWYKASNVSETGHVHVAGFPYTFSGGGASGSYQCIMAGYLAHSNAQYGTPGTDGTGARWQHNSNNQFQLYAQDGSHDGTGNAIEAHGFGIMRIFH